jgi:hypothetical protein
MLRASPTPAGHHHMTARRRNSSVAPSSCNMAAVATPAAT